MKLLWLILLSLPVLAHDQTFADYNACYAHCKDIHYYKECLSIGTDEASCVNNNLNPCVQLECSHIQQRVQNEVEECGKECNEEYQECQQEGETDCQPEVQTCFQECVGKNAPGVAIVPPPPEVIRSGEREECQQHCMKKFDHCVKEIQSPAQCRQKVMPCMQKCQPAIQGMMKPMMPARPMMTPAMMTPGIPPEQKPVEPEIKPDLTPRLLEFIIKLEEMRIHLNNAAERLDQIAAYYEQRDPARSARIKDASDKLRALMNTMDSTRKHISDNIDNPEQALPLMKEQAQTIKEEMKHVIKALVG